MGNIKTKIEDNILMIKIDLGQDLGRSKSGKSVNIASTFGNQVIAEGVRLGLNCYKPI